MFELFHSHRERSRRIDGDGMLKFAQSALDQPGTGDAGGMNVYVVQLSGLLAEHGIAVDIFTRATSRSLPPVIELALGIVVRHVIAGPLDGLTKTDLPGQLCTFAPEVLRTEASYAPGYYDVLHSHYWLSGQVAALARRTAGRRAPRRLLTPAGSHSPGAGEPVADRANGPDFVAVES